MRGFNKISLSPDTQWSYPLTWVILLLCCSVPTLGQALTQEMEVPEVPEQIEEYQVGPGDSLSIHVFGMEEFDQNVRVSNSGKIHVSYVGIVPVAYMTTDQIEEEISRRLVEQKLLRDPWVRVLVTRYRSQPVFVIGEVTTPGQFMMTGEMHLLDALSKAGGVTPGADTEGFLIRRQNNPTIEVRIRFDAEKNLEDPTYPSADLDATGLGDAAAKPAADQSIRINIRDLREGRNPDLNMTLQGGDVFYVPRRTRENIYIVGEVMFPGAYGLPQHYEHITAARAISYAGGVLKTAKTSNAFIMRHTADGEIQGLPFDFTAIYRGEQTDIPVQPDDIIFVPRSIAKTIGYNMLILVPHLVQQFMIF